MGEDRKGKACVQCKSTQTSLSKQDTGQGQKGLAMADGRKEGHAKHGNGP